MSQNISVHLYWKQCNQLIISCLLYSFFPFASSIKERTKQNGLWALILCVSHRITKLFSSMRRCGRSTFGHLFPGGSTTQRCRRPASLWWISGWLPSGGMRAPDQRPQGGTRSHQSEQLSSQNQHQWPWLQSGKSAGNSTQECNDLQRLDKRVM